MPAHPRLPSLAGAALAFLCAGAHGAGAPTTPRPLALDIDAIVRDAQMAARDQALAARDLSDVFAAADVDELMLEPSLAFVASEFGSAREIVKNAPYTADAINESIQVLPDGNRIVRRRTTLLARDGYGRTRQERKDEHSASVYIFDPIDGKSYALNTDRKIAVRIPRVPSAPVPPVPPDAPPPPLAPPPPPPAPAAPPGVSGTPASRVDVQPGRVVVRRGEGRDGEEVRIEVVRIGRGDSMAAIAPTAPLPPFTLPTLPRGAGETKKLGTRDFDGVKADGTQTTHTIPAGEIGNEKPIAITSERWFSPEYNIVVYAKQSDPRTGETIYRLANFKRGEPPAEFFKVPADYKAKGDRAVR